MAATAIIGIIALTAPVTIIFAILILVGFGLIWVRTFGTMDSIRLTHTCIVFPHGLSYVGFRNLPSCPCVQHDGSPSTCKHFSHQIVVTASELQGNLPCPPACLPMA